MPKIDYSLYRDEIFELSETHKSSSAIAEILIKKYGFNIKTDSVRRAIDNILKGPVTEKHHEALAEECESIGIPIEDVNHYWYKGKSFSIHAKNGQKGYFEIKDELVADMQKFAPKYPNLTYPKVKDGHLLVIDPADIHIGKLCSAFETGDQYNSDIAVKRVKDGVLGIIEKAKGFPIDRILLIVGNDCLHVDTPRSTTTSGTFQDSHLMWYDAFRIAMDLYRETIEMLVQIAPVHVQYDPSNHDYTNGFFLIHSLEAWFSKSKNITFNATLAHRKYFEYGLNLIGTSHGDGAKPKDLPLLMAHEAPDLWAKCKHRYVYYHHIHHKDAKDIMGVCVESLRSPSGTDSWHHRNGYQHAPKAIEGYIHHKTHGQIARLTNIF